MNAQSPEPGELITAVPRVILIGGTSHAGKSSVASVLASRPGWVHRSTDHLARHPGRPWGEVPPHVAEHYLGLDLDALMASVLAHYRRLAPDIEVLVNEHADNEAALCLVLEGSALLPESIAHHLAHARIAAIWLEVEDDIAASRIRESSDYGNRDARGRVAIDKFIARTEAFNRVMSKAARANGLAVVKSSEGIDGVARACLSSIAHSGTRRE